MTQVFVIRISIKQIKEPYFIIPAENFSMKPIIWRAWLFRLVLVEANQSLIFQVFENNLMG